MEYRPYSAFLDQHVVRAFFISRMGSGFYVVSDCSAAEQSVSLNPNTDEEDGQQTQSKGCEQEYPNVKK
ncbi:hypothetical protein JZ751_009075 [Albula glossodonta]|uniref:Uncharacterized protein n=1 Tax=Albula glossodonta TaxID=121402 RepID=A0A8T2N917_9TELE|nr:hypothetical protein JZ751_009075 [Albula glossodonta]